MATIYNNRYFISIWPWQLKIKLLNHDVIMVKLEKIFNCFGFRLYKNNCEVGKVKVVTV